MRGAVLRIQASGGLPTWASFSKQRVTCLRYTQLRLCRRLSARAEHLDSKRGNWLQLVWGWKSAGRAAASGQWPYPFLFEDVAAVPAEPTCCFAMATLAASSEVSSDICKHARSKLAKCEAPADAAAPLCPASAAGPAWCWVTRTNYR